MTLGFITAYPITIMRQSNYSINSNIHIIHTIHNDPQCQKIISVAINLFFVVFLVKVFQKPFNKTSTFVISQLANYSFFI